MSESKYEPGTVAMLRAENGHEFLAVRTLGGSSGNYWSAPQGWPKEVSGYEIVAVRPLVVLDPEDHKQVAQLLNKLQDMSYSAHACGAFSCLAEALRSLARPPKPAEPQGLGAVVEDARGDFWVYTGLRNAKDGETRLWFHGSLPADYADIAAVKVLSEGIQP